MALDDYRRKRDFRVTREPRGRAGRTRDALTFVVQKHAASHLHYDFRLELDGVLKSWAVPKGPSLDPEVKRLAVHVEDHPIEYGGFEGIIPRGQYGGGTVMLWDRGTWSPAGDARAAYRKGRLKFALEGERLHGRWNLVRSRRAASGGGKEQWLLFKENDEEARAEADGVLTEEVETSVATGRTMDEIAADRDAEWQSDRQPAAASDGAAKGARTQTGAAPVPAEIPGARRRAFPAAVSPELATLVDAVPTGDDWVHEIKYDGYRIVCMLQDGRARLVTRGGKDWTDRFPAVAAALQALPARAAVLDGEVAVMDERGVSSFQMLQNALGGRGSAPPVFHAFDLAHLDGYDLRGAALTDRKALLRGLLGGGAAGVVRYSDHVVGRGAEFYRQACDWELEGIISKRAGSRYQSKRTKDWVKVKCTRRQEFVIGGYTEPRGTRSHFGALLVGVYDPGGELRYAGKVGTGFGAETLRDLAGRLAPLVAESSPFADYGRKGRRPRDVTWVEPRLVAEVTFTEWTDDGQLRHPAFQGLREDKRPEEVVREAPGSPPGGAPAEPAAAPARPLRRRPASPPSAGASERRGKGGETEVAGVRISSPERVVYPGLGLTKAELARYYERIADWVVPHVRGRALTLVRCPQGQGAECFYQKHVEDNFPAEIHRVTLKETGDRKGVYAHVDDVRGIVALVQMGVLEMHTWGSRVDLPERPDQLVMDLDPGDGVPWARVVESALHVRARLEELGLESFLKTTGGKGLHVVVPLARRNTWADAKRFAQALAVDVARRHPGRYVTTAALASRKGKIYIDYLRNARGSTAIAAYSVRARPGAPTSVPLRWDELSPRLDPTRFTPDAVARRVRALKQDPWDGHAAVRQSLTKKIREAVGSE